DRLNILIRNSRRNTQPPDERRRNRIAGQTTLRLSCNGRVTQSTPSPGEKPPGSGPVPTKVKDGWPSAWLPWAPRGVTMKRNRRRPELSLQERLKKFARDARTMAKTLPPSIEHSEQLAKARDGEAAVRIDLWLSSPGLRRPK